MKATILCGISGSGKSTLARELVAGATNAVVVSADHYFETGPDGEYIFNPAELPAAHGFCLRRYVDILRVGSRPVIVDNTNTSLSELAPYASLALAYGYELEILILDCDPEVALSRNIHGVPRNSLFGQYCRIQGLKDALPPWWPARTL